MAINKRLLRQVQAARNHPNVIAFLNMLSASEGTTEFGYQQGFGRRNKIESLADHPRTFHTFKQTDGKKNRTSAAGRYQFLSRTWDDMAGKLGLADFGPESQDLAAIGLIAQAGALDDLVGGNIDAALRKTGKIWASLPTAPSAYKQPKRDRAFINRFFDKNNQPTEAALAPVDVSEALAAVGKPSNTPPTAQPSTRGGEAADMERLVRQVAGETQPPRENGARELASNLLPGGFSSSFTSLTRPTEAAGGAADTPSGIGLRDLTPDWANLYQDSGPATTAQSIAEGGAGQSLPSLDMFSDPMVVGAIDADAQAARDNAMVSMFGDQSITPTGVRLPPEVDRAIRRFLEEVNA